MSAAGNDFIMVDNRRGVIRGGIPRLAVKLCHRQYSIGADGLILLGKSTRADFRMHYYNADGSRAAMCGNGARCIVKFASLAGAASGNAVFETDAGILKGRVFQSSVRVEMPEPSGVRLDYGIRAGGKKLRVSSVNTGVPHVVIFVPDVEKSDVNGTGRIIRCHREYAPGGTNVNFVQVQGKKRGKPGMIKVRTYERGVEAETLSCGTGSIASAVIAGLKGFAVPPVRVMTRSGIVFRIFYVLEGGNAVSGVKLEGPADVSFTGEVVI